MNKKISIIVASTIAVIALVLVIQNKPHNELKHNSVNKKSSPDPSKKNHLVKTQIEVFKDTPVIKIDRNGVVANSERWERIFFNNYLDETIAKMPTKDDLKKMDARDSHINPAVVMEMGLRLGKIKKQVKLNKDFETKAVQFYENCADREGGMTPVRGLCLANLIYLKKQNSEELDQQRFPEVVRELAKRALEFNF